MKQRLSFISAWSLNSIGVQRTKTFSKAQIVAEGGQGPDSVWGMGQVAGGVGKLHGENGPRIQTTFIVSYDMTLVRLKALGILDNTLLENLKY